MAHYLSGWVSIWQQRIKYKIEEPEIETTNWKNISYLENGTENQKRVFITLKKHAILDALSRFNPVLVSTVCVDLDTEGSDLDIICQHKDLNGFRTAVISRFKNYPGFKQWMRKSDDEEVVTSFHADGFEIEIFSSTVPVEEQFAYRHLSMMERTIRIGGEPLRKKVKGLKMSGLKTEPSFAKILGLPGDPFLAFLELEKLNDNQLSELIKKRV